MRRRDPARNPQNLAASRSNGLRHEASIQDGAVRLAQIVSGCSGMGKQVPGGRKRSPPRGRAPRSACTSKNRFSSVVSEAERGDARLSVTEVMSHLVAERAFDLASKQVAI